MSSTTSTLSARVQGWVLEKPVFGSRADLPGEGEVLRRHLLAVAPFEVGLELDGDRHALLAVGAILDLGEPVLDGRQLGADQAGILPARVVSRDLAHDEAERVGFDDLGIDIGMQRRGKLRDADGELILGGLRPGLQRASRPKGPPRKREKMFHDSLTCEGGWMSPHASLSPRARQRGLRRAGARSLRPSCGDQVFAIASRGAARLPVEG